MAAGSNRIRTAQVARSRATPPLLVVVSGAPGSGKTTLTARLAPALGLPLLSKDRLQHVLLDALGASDAEAGRQLGAATFMQMYFVAGQLLDARAGAVLEANFLRGISEQHLAPLAGRARAVVVHCHTTPELTVRRFRERFERGERHRLSHDLDALPRLVQWLDEGRYEPPEIGAPTMRVDTTDGYAPTLEQIVAFVAQHY